MLAITFELNGHSLTPMGNRSGPLYAVCLTACAQDHGLMESGTQELSVCTQVTMIEVSLILCILEGRFTMGA